MDYRWENLCFNIYYSDEILENILNFLDIREQMKFLKINKRFKFILTNFVWPKTCNNVILFKTPDTNIISLLHNNKEERETLMTEVQRAKVLLEQQQCEEFLNLNAVNIKALKVSSIYYRMGTSITNIELFQNLLELSYHRLVLHEDHMKIIAKECKKLKKFHLLKCFDQELKTLIPGVNFDIENLYQMKYLNELMLENDQTAPALIRCQCLQEIFINLNLRKLILENFVIINNDAEIMECPNNIMEILNMGSITPSAWNGFINILNYFINLQELYIKVRDCNTCFNTKVINILTKKCPELYKLCLENCDMQVEDFRVLQQLEHLSLHSCGGLTFSNFQQILGGLSLKTFALINTRIYGSVYHTYISPTLQEITIDSLQFLEISEAFEKAFNSFENLQTLNWYKGSINDNWLLEKCPKLKYFHITNPHLLEKTLLKMFYLSELTFTSCQGVTWNLISLIMRNLKLKCLRMKTNEIISNRLVIPDNACGIRTTLQTILIPCLIFKMAQSYWLDLLYLNEKLYYTIYGKWEQIMDEEFLLSLLKNERFCGRVKCLKICGFKMGKKQNVKRKYY